MSDSNTLKNIKKIKRKRKTILLLDSFDEASKAMDDYENYMQTLCNETKFFYKIVMTCRTQFFPNSDKEPKVTGNIKVGVGKKNIEFEKYYILPFNNSEIETYLKKKYNHFFEKKKFERAHELVLRCPKLMVRPMLLSYIDDLIDDWKVEYNTVYEIYDKLVSKWIEREALYKNSLLHVFSEKVAEYMYHNNTVHIEENDIMKLCKEYNIDLRSIEAKSRSLLNRNANGLYKFAHTSFLEFFLSKKAFKKEEFRKRIISNGFNKHDMLEFFIKEKSLAYLHDFLQDNSKKLKSGIFRYLTFPEADLSGENIIDCTFEGCIFSKINFKFLSFDNVNFVDSDLGESIFLEVDLQNTKFANVDLRKCKFHNVHFENANFEGSNLKGINLRKADLRKASLSGAILEDVDFTGAYLSGLDLSNINFQSAKFVFADLINSNLVNSNLTQADLRGAKLNASIWYESDIQKSLSQLKVADFTYLMISENNELKRVERYEVFLNKD